MGFFVGQLHRSGNLGIEHVRVACGGRDVRVVEGALHELEVAGLAQELGAEVMPEVMEAESINASACEPAPCRLDAFERLAEIAGPAHDRRAFVCTT